MARMLIVISSLEGGGAERVASLIANAMCEKGHTVHVVTLSAVSATDYPLVEGVERLALGLLGNSRGVLGGVLNSFKRVQALRKAIVDIDPDSILSFLDKTNLLVLLAGLGLQRHIVVAERNHPPSLPMSRFRNGLRKFLYYKAAYVIGQTEVTKRWLVEHTNARKVRVIPNSVQLPLPILSPIVDPSIVNGHPFFLSVGRDSEQKGFHRMLSMFEKVVETHKDWKLVFIGPDVHSKLQKEVDSKKLSDNVMCVGKVGNVSDWYQAAGIFALPSHFEGFPNVLLEAMSHGCAVISFNINAGPADMITDKYNGMLVANDDEAAFIDKMNTLVSDPVLRQTLGHNAKAVCDIFDQQKVMGYWEEVLFCHDLPDTKKISE